MSAEKRALLAQHVEETINSIAQLDVDHRLSASAPQRWVDHTTELFARPWFLSVGISVIVGWIGLNGLAPLFGYVAPDPAPFIWLNSLVSICAFFIVGLILSSQRHEDHLARHHARLTLQLTIQGEQKTAKVIALLEELRRDSPSVRDRIDREAEAMTETAKPGALLDALKDAQATVATHRPLADDI